MGSPEISVILPCFNEEGFIRDSVRSLLQQNTAGKTLEVIVVDGMSTDGTREELEAIPDKRLVVLDNPQKTVPYAMQAGLEKARGQFIFRADAHASYPNDYIVRLLPYLEQQNLVTVGGVIRTVSSSEQKSAQAIAVVMNSRFGVGSSFRTFSGPESREAETVPFGGWRRSTLEAIGGFDLSFTRAQDLELNIRLKKAGGRIICVPDVVVTYYSRPSYRKFAGMSYQYGYWKVLVNAKHSVLSSLRQLFPLTLLLLSGLPLLAIPFLGTAWWAGLVPVGTYGLGAIMISVRAAIRSRKVILLPRILFGYTVAHFVYGYGYLRALINTYILRRHQWARVSTVTR